MCVNSTGNMNIVVCGINGAMGQVLKQELKYYENINLVGSISPRNNEFGHDIKEKVDVIIDFSNPANLDCLIEYAKKNNSGLLICTTGYNEEEKNKIIEAGKYVPVLLSSNTSLGITIFRKTLKVMSEELNGFDINIIEKHHKKKKDAPSGTAKTIAEDIMNATGRDHIDTLAMRVGNIPGEHSVIFSGVDEVIEIKHMAYSKKVFARGALDLVLKLGIKEPGYYLMEDFF